MWRRIMLYWDVHAAGNVHAGRNVYAGKHDKTLKVEGRYDSRNRFGDHQQFDSIFYRGGSEDHPQ